MTLERPYSILVTDDDPICRESLREIFEPAGYRTLMAESGEEAIDIVRGEEIDLAVMDQHLGTLTGLETIEIMRQIQGRVVPMILVSADHDENLMRKALSAQAFCVLAKPVSKNVVIYVVARALEKYS